MAALTLRIMAWSIAVLIYALCFPGCVRAGECASTVSVADFGAIPDDRQDDTAAIMSALATCRKKTSKLVFPKGRYDLQSADGRNALFECNGLSGLIIDGCGSTLIVSGITGVFSFSDCKDVTVRNLAVDWARAPFSEGKVLEVGGNYFDVQVAARYPVEGGEAVGAYMDFDPSTRLPRPQGIDAYHTVVSTQLLRPQVLRVNVKGKPGLESGSLVLLRHHVYDRDVFTFQHCSDVAVEDVTVYTAPGMGFRFNYCSDVRLSRVNIVPRSRMLMSTTADGVHMSSCKGKLKIRECEFRGMGDDAINTYPGLYLTIQKRIDDRTLLVMHNLRIPEQPEQGSLVEFVRQDDLLVFAKAVVKSTLLNKDNSIRISFTRPLPTTIKEGDLLANSGGFDSIHISKCKVSSNRARGMLVQGQNAVVEDCEFENCTSGGVWVLPEAVFFYQGTGSRNITIRNNTFTNCNYAGPIGEGVVSVYAYFKDFGYPTKPGIHSSIVIENNRITGSDNCGIFLAGVDGALITNNTIEDTCRNPKWSVGNAAIRLEGCANVRLERNIVHPEKQGAKMLSPLVVSETCSTSTVEYIANIGTARSE